MRISIVVALVAKLAFAEEGIQEAPTDVPFATPVTSGMFNVGSPPNTTVITVESGIYLNDLGAKKVDDFIRAQAQDNARLTAENESLLASMEELGQAPPPNLVAVLIAVAVGVAAGTAGTYLLLKR